MKLKKLTKTNTLSTATVSEKVFGLEANDQLLAQAVRVYRSNKRQGTSKVKTRGEVRGSRRKIWKQKGTGNARHGAKSAPIFVGGGVAHGPTGLENWTLKLTKPMKKKALAVALSMQAQNIVLVDGLDQLDGKTKSAWAVITKLKLEDKKILVVYEDNTELLQRSFANIKNATLVHSALLNALEVASADSILIQPKAYQSLEDRLVKKTPIKEKKVKK